MLMFWVTDNFLMHKNKANRRYNTERSLLTRTKVKYRSIRRKPRRHNSETDILLSGDDELLDADSFPVNRNALA